MESSGLGVGSGRQLSGQVPAGSGHAAGFRPKDLSKKDLWLLLGIPPMV